MLKLVWKQLDKYKAEESPQGAGLDSWEELSRVNDITRELDWEIQSLEKLLPVSLTGMPQKCRGLIDFGGQVLKSFFGTATSSEVQELQSVVSIYEDQNEDIIHAIKSLLTLLQTVDKETTEYNRLTKYSSNTEEGCF
jgi:ABC-type transporter Mla subunit MlaD